MRYLLLSCLLLVSTCPIFALDDDTIIGKWIDQKGEAKIEIYKQGNQFFGKLYWLKDPFDKNGNVRKDLNNPETSLRDRDLKGIEILKNFTYNRDHEWTGGKIYDPRSGKTYDCKISISEEGELNVRGFIGFSIIGKTEIMIRLN
ncbi:putative SIGNAL PEPTIDE PROTEIN [Arcticibacter svalbardensis MN12-7]|uniref:Putative SIGNAL PEPTIDE PROTEIN n=1 Tax=Arcticibacter svalbardensis MN12-7 TaxID=1150600 RepID=R9GU68_9SPHI|nr:DUF2147 domain-containing protein [Arcticibacter svalbardensis]EOR95256.1 putative SIGNAL PEPTIDE PROTEIN [Arcticibacter svalbardensis MN12-7]